MATGPQTRQHASRAVAWGTEGRSRCFWDKSLHILHLHRRPLCLLVSSLLWARGVFALCVASQGLSGLLDSSWVQSAVGSGRRPGGRRERLGVRFPWFGAPSALSLSDCVGPSEAAAPVGQWSRKSYTKEGRGGSPAATCRSECPNAPLCPAVEPPCSSWPEAHSTLLETKHYLLLVLLYNSVKTLY